MYTCRLSPDNELSGPDDMVIQQTSFPTHMPACTHRHIHSRRTKVKCAKKIDAVTMGVPHTQECLE